MKTLPRPLRYCILLILINSSTATAVIFPLDTLLNDYRLIEIDVASLLEQSKSSAFEMDLGDTTVQLSLERNHLWAENLRPVLNDGFSEKPTNLTEPFTFEGTVIGSEGSRVRLTICSDTSWVSGYLAFGDRWMSIQPRGDVGADKSRRQHYIYGKSDIGEIGGHWGTVHDHDDDERTEPGPMATADPNESTRILKIIAYGDAEYYNYAGDNWASWMTAQMNDVEGIFKNDIDVEFEITHLGTYVNMANQPVSSLSPVLLLFQLEEAFRNASSSHRQITHLISGKDLTADTLGFARQAQLGRCFGYSLSSRGPINFATLLICAHEIGHHLNADHQYGAIEPNWNILCLYEQYTIMQAPRYNPACMVGHFSPANISRMEEFDNWLALATTLNPTLSLDHGAEYSRAREVSLNALMNDSKWDYQYIGIANKDETFGHEECISGSSDLTWTLTEGDGPKEVMLRAFDFVDNSTTIYDTIILDQTPPTAVGALQSGSHTVGSCSHNREIAVQWNPATDATSGIQGYSYIWNEDGPVDPDDVWEADHDGTSTGSVPLANGDWYFSVRAIDKAGWSGPVASIGPFVINPPPSPGTLETDQDTVNAGVPFTLSWSSLDGADNYRIYEDGSLIYDGSETETTLTRTEELTYQYELEVCNDCGCNDTTATRSVTVLIPTSVEQIESETLPSEFVLYPNYPNPFNPETHIEFGLPRASHVKLEVYNVLGGRLRTLVNERLAAGYKRVTWDGTSDLGIPAASGVYFYRLETENFFLTRKMLLLK